MVLANSELTLDEKPTSPSMPNAESSQKIPMLDLSEQVNPVPPMAVTVPLTLMIL